MRRATLVAITVVAVLVLQATVSAAQGGGEFETLPTEAGGFDGEAFTSLLVGDELWVGGAFTTARDYTYGLPEHQTRGLGVLNINSGTIDTTKSFSLSHQSSLSIDISHGHTIEGGGVFALATDSSSTVWAGGWFETAEGQVRTNLASYDVTTGDLLDFAPAINGPVNTLVHHDGWLYVGGDFDDYDGGTGDALVRVNPTTGATDPGFTPPLDADDRVWTLDLHGSTLYAGGDFGVLALNAATGADTGTNFADGSGEVLGVAVNADGTRLAIANEDNRVYASTTAGASLWSQGAGGPMLSVAWTEQTLYVGLTHQWDSSQDRRKLVALNPDSGALDTVDFIPELNQFWAGRSVLVTPQGLVVTGQFSKIATGDYDNEPGINARRVAIFRPTGTWDPAAPLTPTRPDGNVNCDGRRNIVDALIIAQYVVGVRQAVTDCPLSEPANQLLASAGDVNVDGSTNIVDALLVAQCAALANNELCPEDP